MDLGGEQAFTGKESQYGSRDNANPEMAQTARHSWLQPRKEELATKQPYIILVSPSRQEKNRIPLRRWV
jgi:hypothetical protein